MRVQLEYMNIRAWALLTVFATAVTPALSSAEILEQIVVKVNGDIVTKTEFEQRQVAALRTRNQQQGGGNLQGDALRQAIAEITPRLILEAVDELLLLQRGKELGFKMTDQQYQTIVEQIRKENRLESEEAFQAALKQEGMTPADLRRNLERQVIISNVQRQEVMQKVAFNEAEGRKYHAEHIEEFTKPGTVTLREIFVSVPGDGNTVNVAADEDAKRKIDDVRRRIMDGEDFSKVAAEQSEAPSRANGGLIGPLARTELTASMVQLLQGLKPGDVSPAVRMPRGYAIFKFESETQPQVMTAEEAAEEIQTRLWQQKRQVELDKYLVRLRSQASIEWKNDELRKAYESEIGRSASTQTPAAPAAETPAASETETPAAPESKSPQS
jgi:peptidyl-prolyl cis-trans isomerase SurA